MKDYRIPLVLRKNQVALWLEKLEGRKTPPSHDVAASYKETANVWLRLWEGIVICPDKKATITGVA